MTFLPPEHWFDIPGSSWPGNKAIKLKLKISLIYFEDVHVDPRSESSGGVCGRGSAIISEVKSVIVVLAHHPSADWGELIALTFLRYRSLTFNKTLLL